VNAQCTVSRQRFAAEDYPLADLEGAAPAAPAWFDEAIGHTPETAMIDVGGTRIETLAWGRRGDPGLIFIHGNLGHAHWWSFIAPFFADRFRVIAVSLAGMGGSDHRADYEAEDFARDVLVAGAAMGLFGGGKPIVVAHSAGAGAGAFIAGDRSDDLAGFVILDSGIRPAEMMPPPHPPRTHRPVYPTITAALARYRFAPPQPCDNLFIADWIARHALGPAPGGEGFTWRFDPAVFAKVRASDAWDHLRRATCRIAIINGERSKLTTPERVKVLRDALAPDTPCITIPDAAHHLMVDQPLALVSALRQLFADWRAGASG
jgi:pimeloyl-ACP methyl ester carboxylesterase